MKKQEFVKLMESNATFQKMKELADECGYCLEHAFVSNNCPKVSLLSKTSNEFYDFNPRFYLTISINFEKKSFDYKWTV
jgi:hypothetical protein